MSETYRYQEAALKIAKIFDISTEAGLKAAERYQARLENLFNTVIVKPIGWTRVRIEGKDRATQS